MERDSERKREGEGERERVRERALRGVCVAWVETAPRSPTGRIIIPIHAHTHAYTRAQQRAHVCARRSARGLI